MCAGRLDVPAAATTTVDELEINLGGSIRLTRLALTMLEASLSGRDRLRLLGRGAHGRARPRGLCHDEGRAALARPLAAARAGRQRDPRRRGASARWSTPVSSVTSRSRRTRPRPSRMRSSSGYPAIASRSPSARSGHWSPPTRIAPRLADRIVMRALSDRCRAPLSWSRDWSYGRSRSVSAIRLIVPRRSSHLATICAICRLA
jgi:hypothetical protein